MGVETIEWVSILTFLRRWCLCEDVYKVRRWVCGYCRGSTLQQERNMHNFWERSPMERPNDDTWMAGTHALSTRDSYLPQRGSFLSNLLLGLLNKMHFELLLSKVFITIKLVYAPWKEKTNLMPPYLQLLYCKITLLQLTMPLSGLMLLLFFF